MFWVQVVPCFGVRSIRKVSFGETLGKCGTECLLFIWDKGQVPKRVDKDCAIGD